MPSDLISLGEALQVIQERQLDPSAWANAIASGRVPSWKAEDGARLQVRRSDAETWEP